jgi:hypothetical protein
MASDGLVCVRLHQEDKSLAELMAELRQWLDASKITPRDFRTAQSTVELVFASPSDAEQFRRRFSPTQP